MKFSNAHGGWLSLYYDFGTTVTITSLQ